MNCPKVNAPSIHLSDEQEIIWNESKPIDQLDQPFIEAILTRYGFDEV